MSGFDESLKGQIIKDFFDEEHHVKKEENQSDNDSDLEYIDFNFLDPRCHNLGVRIITGQPGTYQNKLYSK